MTDDQKNAVLSPEEIATFLDRLRADLGREPSPHEIVRRVRNPRGELERRARLSFTFDPETALHEINLQEARLFIRREKRPTVVIPDGHEIEVPKSVSDPSLRFDLTAETSYISVFDKHGNVAETARGAIAREMMQEIAPRIRSREFALRTMDIWSPAEALLKAIESVTAPYLEHE